MKLRPPYWHEIFIVLTYGLAALLVIPSLYHADNWLTRTVILVAVGMLILVHWIAFRRAP